MSVGSVGLVLPARWLRPPSRPFGRFRGPPCADFGLSPSPPPPPTQTKCFGCSWAGLVPCYLSVGSVHPRPFDRFRGPLCADFGMRSPANIAATRPRSHGLGRRRMARLGSPSLSVVSVPPHIFSRLRGRAPADIGWCSLLGPVPCDMSVGSDPPSPLRSVPWPFVRGNRMPPSPPPHPNISVMRPPSRGLGRCWKARLCSLSLSVVSVPPHIFARLRVRARADVGRCSMVGLASCNQPSVSIPAGPFGRFPGPSRADFGLRSTRQYFGNASACARTWTVFDGSLELPRPCRGIHPSPLLLWITRPRARGPGTVFVVRVGPRATCPWSPSPLAPCLRGPRIVPCPQISPLRGRMRGPRWCDPHISALLLFDISCSAVLRCRLPDDDPPSCILGPQGSTCAGWASGATRPRPCWHVSGLGFASSAGLPASPQPTAGGCFPSLLLG